MTFEWPAEWLAAVPPRRVGGGALGGTPPVPPDGSGAGHRMLDRWRSGAGTALHRLDPTPLRDAGLDTVDSAPAGWTPAGLAAALAADSTRRDADVRLDLVLAERGPAFAVGTVAELLAVRWRYYTNGRPSLEPTSASDAWHVVGGWFGLARRLRVRLVGLPDAPYAEAVAALEPYRRARAPQRLLTSYLATDRADWAAADCAGAAALGAGHEPRLLYGAATTVEQFLAVARVEKHRYHGDGVEDVAAALDVLGCDAAPVLGAWADRTVYRAGLDVLWTALTLLPGDAPFAELARRHRSSFAVPHVRAVMSREPERAVRVFATIGSELLAEQVMLRPEVAERVLPGLGPEAAARVRAALDPADTVERVPADELPPLLHRPPWTVKRAAKPVVVDGLVASDEVTMVWRPGERESRRPRAWTHLQEWPYTPGRLERLLAGQVGWRDTWQALSTWPDEVLTPVVHRIPVRLPEYHGWTDPQWMLAVRFGAAALHPVLAVARANPRYYAGPLLPYGSTEVATQMAAWFATTPSVRQLTTAWFTRHPATAARGLVPPALGKAGPARRQAERVLRWLIAAGFEAEVRKAAAGYGPAAADGIDAFLRTDPLSVLPVRPPTLPSWLDARLLPPLRVPDGRALPVEAVGHVCTVLAVSTLDEPYGGVDVVRETCDPASLEAFVWALVERWTAAGHPTKERWIFTALGLVGGDTTVGRLVDLLPGWASTSTSQPRAMLGVDVLAAIGTDGALTHLDRYARKAKTATMRERATNRINDLADKRGFTPEQLADRLVPDFDLGPDGRTTLDYGRRRFTVGFDEQLRPFVTDADGSPLKALPKPGGRDDERAAAEYTRFTALKRAVRTVAGEQVRRFEKAMVWQRRWTADELRTLFVTHPLLQHLARRLVWLTDDGASFRVAEDRSHADVDDNPYRLPDDAVVRVAHPLHLGAELPGWVEVFADYGILQPFPQLHRETVSDPRPLARFVGATTTGGRVLGLRSRRWELDDPDRFGSQFQLDLPGGLAVVVGIDPGLDFGGRSFDPKAPQVVMEVRVTSAGGVPADEDGLDPVSRSEVLRDLAHVLG